MITTKGYLYFVDVLHPKTKDMVELSDGLTKCVLQKEIETFVLKVTLIKDGIELLIGDQLILQLHISIDLVPLGL
jgi:hypothetical protein